MKAIHYDAEGDILSVTFSENVIQKQTGFELSDNLVIYYNPETCQPIKLIILSYLALLEGSDHHSIPLEGLANAPTEVRASVIALLDRAPLTAFLQLINVDGVKPPAGRLRAIFTLAALQVFTTSEE